MDFLPLPSHPRYGQVVQSHLEFELEIGYAISSRSGLRGREALSGLPC